MKRFAALVMIVMLFGAALMLMRKPARVVAATETEPAATLTIVPVVAAPPTATPPFPAVIPVYCTVTGDLHLRTQPNTDAAVITWLKAGDVVTRMYNSWDGWVAVSTADGMSGYAHGNWLTCR